MLGNRYGWCQPKEKSDKLLMKTFEKGSIYFPWVNNFSDRSITELEIRHAVLNNTPVIYFLFYKLKFFFKKRKALRPLKVVFFISRKQILMKLE
jgi:hypothetical protein